MRKSLFTVLAATATATLVGSVAGAQVADTIPGTGTGTDEFGRTDGRGIAPETYRTNGPIDESATCSYQLWRVLSYNPPASIQAGSGNIVGPQAVTLPTLLAGPDYFFDSRNCMDWTPAPEDPAHEIPGDSVSLVNLDIAPDTYHTAGPVDGNGQCTWTLFDSPDRDGVLPVINTGSSAGSQTVTIRGIFATDYAFESTNCQNWITDLPAATTISGDESTVLQNIVFGTYSTNGPLPGFNRCEWIVRPTDGSIRNQETFGPATIVIDEGTDLNAIFASMGCQDWHLDPMGTPGTTPGSPGSSGSLGSV